MTHLIHTYGYVSEVTNELWTAHPDLVQNDAEQKLRGAIRNDGRSPYGRIRLLRILGQTYKDVGVRQVSRGFLWVPATYERVPMSKRLEWRDEIFCDPEFTIRWRITYVMDGLDVVIPKIEMKAQAIDTPKPVSEVGPFYYGNHGTSE